MKKILLAGHVACGKTTLCQCLNGMEMKYKKTQAVEVIHETIDTPGEYVERRSLFRALVVTASEVDQVLFVQDASQDRFMFAPGQAAAFPIPVAGVVSKADLAGPKQISQAAELLEMAGASPIFVVSAHTGQGIAELKEFLEEEHSDDGREENHG